MKIAVTGASGRVGSRIARDLASRGYDIIAIDDQASEQPGVGTFVQADLTDYAATFSALQEADRVVHLAAINSPIAAPEWQVHNVNVTASYNVLSAAAELGITRVVQTSSVNAIGLAWSSKPAFDYFPLDTAHVSRNEDGYSLSKFIQELQADSLTRRHKTLSVVSLRLHAVLEDLSQAQLGVDTLGEDWAVNGLFGYCTFTSVCETISLALTASIDGHEVLWVVEPETFAQAPSHELARKYFPDTPIRGDLAGRSGFFDISRTRGVLDWTPEALPAEARGRVRL
jgi:NAD(P)-dependent dehydrogenase (short-subunit alcohol dehydrogenase family)